MQFNRRSISGRGAHRLVLMLLTTFVLAGSAMGFTPRAAKSKSSVYGPKRRAIAMANAERYDWAREQREEVLTKAEGAVNQPDDALWRSIHSWEVPRAIGVNRDHGCPNCGQAIYGDRGSNLYAFAASGVKEPWKVQCPNCEELFPKNDFLAFYKSGISEKDGFFHYADADRSLLFNVDHPDPNDPKHKWCVDDGRGWIDEHGHQHQFIATYMYRSAWRVPIYDLAQAYALTGDTRYAHKAFVLLDRLADMYPNLEGKRGQILNFEPGSYWNGIFGPDYWAGGGWASLAMAYDMIYDALPELSDALSFIQAQEKRYEVPNSKASLDDVKKHIEQRLFIDRFSKRGTYSMNGTITEMCEAKVDLVLRDEEAIADFAEVHLPRIVLSRFLNDDGSGNERSVGYDGGAFVKYCSLLV